MVYWVFTIATRSCRSEKANGDKASTRAKGSEEEGHPLPAPIAATAEPAPEDFAKAAGDVQHLSLCMLMISLCSGACGTLDLIAHINHLVPHVRPVPRRCRRGGAGRCRG